MSRDDHSEVHIGSDVHASPLAQERRDGVMRVAIVGDFSGRASSAPRVWPVDRDNLDEVLAQVAPSVRLHLDADLPAVEATFAALDDFHPDRLVKLPIFESLRAIELRSLPPARSAPAERAPSVSAGGLLDMILDADAASPPPAPTLRAAQPTDELSAFIAASLKKHAATDLPARQADVANKVDAVLASMLRVVLHHPEFQALEARWRGVDFLTRRLDTDGPLKLYLVDLSPEYVQLAFASPNNWHLMILDASFGPGDVTSLLGLGALGAQSGCPVLAGAKPNFVGMPSFANADAEDWLAEPAAQWEQFRASNLASFIGLAAPRVLLRLPYGKGGEECESLRFEEVDPGLEPHERFLWANGAFVAGAIALAPMADGDAPATHGTVDHMPLWITSVGGLPESLPCAETLLGSQELSQLLDLGLIPLQSMRDGDMVRASRIQSLARPPRPLAIGGAS